MRQAYGNSEVPNSNTVFAKVSSKVVYNVTGCDSVFDPAAAAVSINVPSSSEEFKASIFPLRSMNKKYAISSIRNALSNNPETKKETLMNN